MNRRSPLPRTIALSTAMTLLSLGLAGVVLAAAELAARMAFRHYGSDLRIFAHSSPGLPSVKTGKAIPTRPLDYHAAYQFKHCDHLNATWEPYWIGPPACRGEVIFKQVESGEIVSTSTYSFEEHGLRNTPASREGSRDFLIFLGCSYTLGQGVNDEETFPNQVVKAQTHPVRAFNMGMGGWGPSHILRLFQKPRLTDPRLKAIQGDNGTAVYTFIDDHVRRVVNTMSYLGQVRPVYTYEYSLRDGEIIGGRSLAETHPALANLMSFLGNSRLLTLFNIDYPPIRAEDLALTVRILAEVRRILKEDYRVNRFVVSIFPGQAKYSTTLVPLLRSAGIEVFDFSSVDLNDWLHGKEHFNGDNHPTAAAYAIYAQLVNTELLKNHGQNRE